MKALQLLGNFQLFQIGDSSTIKDLNPIALYLVFISTTLVVVSLFILLIIEGFDRLPTRPKPRKHSSPVIGYKKAGIRITVPQNGNLENGHLSFKGVTGEDYSVCDEAIPYSPGFHIYKKFSDAAQHPQDGDVLLEVLGYGKIDEHEDGYKTTKQRVLQVIIPNCTVCGEPAIGLADTAPGYNSSLCANHMGRGPRFSDTNLLPVMGKVHTIDGHKVSIVPLNEVKVKAGKRKMTIPAFKRTTFGPKAENEK